MTTEKMFSWQTAIRLFGVVYEIHNVLCADCVRPSVCYFVLDYTPKLHISSAQGISYGASGAAALAAETKERWNGT